MSLKNSRKGTRKVTKAKTCVEEREYEEYNPVKVKNIQKSSRKEKPVTKKKVEGNPLFLNTPISEVLVPCNCNKCGASVVGELISSIYSPLTGLEIPFISYSCSNCNHSGKRSVQTQALPTLEFERKYF